MALQDSFEAEGIPTRVQSAIEMREVAEPYVRRKAISHLDHGKVVIFGARHGESVLLDRYDSRSKSS